MDKQKTLERAARMIAARPLSQKELYRRLVEKGETEAAAAAAVARLTELGALNDAEYADMIVRRYAASGYGARRIEQEFKRRGVARETAERAMEKCPGPEAAIDRLLHKKLDMSEMDARAVKRATDALARRGYAWDEISAALRRYRENMEIEIEDE